MDEFTIRIRTPERTTIDEERAALVTTALELSPQVVGAKTEFMAEASAISSSIRIRAFTLDSAEETALRVFTAALGLAGVSSEQGWLTVEPAERVAAL